MSAQTPAEVRRSFSRDNKGIKEFRDPSHRTNKGKNPRLQRDRTNFWPGKRLNYELLEQCKEVICRIPHPTSYYKRLKTEYRLSVLPWSQGVYVDIRQYKNGGPSPVGILLHLDVIAALLPDLAATVQRLVREDQREPEKKAKIEVILG